MLIRGWELSRLFEDEAEGAGEGSSGAGAVEANESPAIEASSSEEPSSEPAGGVNHEENVAVVQEWLSENRTDSTDALPTTATTDELVTPNPVVETTTDAVSNDDAAATSGNEQDELLLNLAEAYDFTREELKGVSNEGLRNLIAREQRRQGAAAAPTEEASATQAAGEVAGDVTRVTFDQLADAIREDMTEQGHDEATIERTVQREKLKWDREDALLADARQAREETQWVRQQYEQERRQQFEAAERQGFFDIVANVAGMEKGLLPLPGEKNAPPERVENLNKWWQNFNLVKQSSAEVQALARTNLPAARAKAANIAFTMTFPEVVARRGQIAHANKILKQSRSVMGSAASAKPSSSVTWTGPLHEHPNVNRAFEKLMRNAT